uniref:Uncharacterized protein n=1 Tax=Timema cristinae TaxID=61476 RepID=A0A7R9H881_TIMCR|nr:unnamed protein product [Timema cristinae]
MPDMALYGGGGRVIVVNIFSQAVLVDKDGDPMRPRLGVWIRCKQNKRPSSRRWGNGETATLELLKITLYLLKMP